MRFNGYVFVYIWLEKELRLFSDQLCARRIYICARLIYRHATIYEIVQRGQFPFSNPYRILNAFKLAKLSSFFFSKGVILRCAPPHSIKANKRKYILFISMNNFFFFIRASFNIQGQPMSHFYNTSDLIRLYL